MAQDTTTDLSMNPAALYREESYTDQRVGTIRQMVPVTAEGEPDAARPTLFVGQAQLMTPMGPLPLSFAIEADTLAKAVDGFAEAAQQAIEEAARELQEMQRERAGGLVVPGAGDLGGMGGPGGLGGAGGPGGLGGKIQLR